MFFFCRNNLYLILMLYLNFMFLSIKWLQLRFLVVQNIMDLYAWSRPCGWKSLWHMSTCFLIAQEFMMFMLLLCKSCGFWKMLDIFGPSWLVACEVRTVPLILVNEFMLNFALTFFGFTVIICITVISCSRMCILGSLPLVLEALWHLDENQLCKPFGMLYILHWDMYERDCCISKCRFPSLTSNLRPDELWWKNIALHCIAYIWLDTMF